MTSGDLSCLALEEYKNGRVTKAELRRLLRFSTRFELDGFLKAHGVWADYTIDDLHQPPRWVDVRSLLLKRTNFHYRQEVMDQFLNERFL